MILSSTLITITKIIGIIAAIIGTGIVSFIGLPIAILYLVIATIVYWQQTTPVFTGTEILIYTVITFLAVFLDNIVLFMGLKKSAASKRGYVGAIIGSIAGLFTGTLVGLALFSAIGAIIGELVHGKTTEDSIRSGFMTAVSLFLGSILRVVLTLIVAVDVLRKLLF
ncbi:DUF456 domain-containing protein [candidate division WWE3 bacterium]|uniref:DUF456 domain-containing protein n=1 Tax=candidate division WWE3 bacterium TaxID=2053526 RepID=A0A955LWV9_UNCKA|nr:DUF456 domain-containing protein [candidate division WWE3 bacterium]